MMASYREPDISNSVGGEMLRNFQQCCAINFIAYLKHMRHFSTEYDDIL